MAFRFKLNEPVQKGFRRIALEQIERAERELSASENAEVATHETRKCIKRVRALLRIGRPGLGEPVYRSENTRMREIAALLAPARDRDVLVQTITKLEALPGEVANAALAAVKKLVLESRDREQPNRGESVSKALEGLADARKKFRRLTLKPADFSTIEHGIAQTYRRGRRAFAEAYAGGDDEAFHDWRKSVQQHWRHMTLLSRAWPAYFEARVESARALSQVLGDDHDLSLLIAHVRGLASERLSPMHIGEIERLARARQDGLRKLAEPRGRQLFPGGANGFARRIGVIWQAGGQIAHDTEEKSPEAQRDASRQASILRS